MSPEKADDKAGQQVQGLSLPIKPEIAKTLLVKTGTDTDKEEDNKVQDHSRYEKTAGSRKDRVLNIAAVIGALAIFGGGMIMRDRLISVIPDINTLYKMAGIDIYQPALEFSFVRTRVGNGNRNILVVEGMVKNSSSRSLDLPAIQLEMRNADKRMVYSWIYKPRPETIAAGEAIHFSTKSVVPKVGARDVRLSFVSKSQLNAETN